jgi:tetratricopeptide (TPR) repeat protein
MAFLGTAPFSTSVSENKTTLALRFKRVALYDPNLVPSVRQRIIQDFSSEKTIPYASPAVLQTMLDMARENGRDELARKVAVHIIEEFTETDYALDARMTLARDEIAKARATESLTERQAHYQEAVKHLDIIREVYAASTEAAAALMMLGEIHRDQREFEKADEAYKSVLGVKAWRTMWPAALYCRGECAMEQRRYEEASAYYERIYVLYGHHTEWVARAYLRRAEALNRLFQVSKAREVLDEMLANDALTALPEAEEARALLDKLGGVR